MAIQSQPSRIPEPFAGSGTKNTIPATNATPSASQAASWASGFPPECSQPISAGGCPVPRNDVNGVLSQLSQDFAFRQDGGIWEWSALADYDAQRMVRGSDGLLYWSVAQSGPGFGAGAIDPTTDDGTYWSSPALRTMPLADKSAKGATTEWVKNLAVAPVYLDPAGSDSNDGFSSATAVKTFAKAIQIASSLPQQGISLVVAAGTYTGNAEFSQLAAKITLNGNVTVSGIFWVGNGSTVLISDSAYTLSINGHVSITDGSNCLFLCPVSITSTSSEYALGIEFSSYCYFRYAAYIENSYADSNVVFAGNSANLYINGQCTVTAASINNEAIVVARTSSLRISENGSLSINGSGTGCTYGLYVYQNSVFSSLGDFTVSAGCVRSQAVSVRYSSTFIAQSGTYEINGTSQSNSTVFALSACSVLFIASDSILTLKSHVSGLSGLYVLWVDNSSSALCGGTLGFTQDAGGSVRYCIVVSGSSVLNASGTLNFGSGSGYATIEVTGNSLADIASGATVSGTITGKRYLVDYGGQIYVHGAGANRLPGDAAGSVTSASYGYYG